jgi:hypothetical protein
MSIRWIIAWFCCPLAILAFHWGPGQRWLDRDLAERQADAADVSFHKHDFQDAAAYYAAAALKLPADDDARRRTLDLAQGSALVRAGDIVEGQELLEKTLRELEEAGAGDSPLGIATRHELAASSYYAAMIMRLEGGAPEDWKPEAERARQQFRLLAEQAESQSLTAVGVEQGNPQSSANQLISTVMQQNLEATIRLEQMDLSELLARPLPKNCPNCKKNLCQRKRKQCADRCNSPADSQKKPSEKKEKQDTRGEIKKSNEAAIYTSGGKGS